ncbi:MAG: glycosyltransferase 87 family protein [Frankiaceae bacterium]
MTGPGRIEARLHALAVRAPRPAWARAALATLLYLAIVAPYVVSQLTRRSRLWLVDLTVYRDAGRQVLHDSAQLYVFDTPLLHLPFTYPPFPGLLSTWLAVVPRLAAGLIWTAAELAAVAWLAARAFRPVLDRTGRGRPFLLAALAGGVLWLDPVREVVKFGQVDLFMVGLALADCVAVRPRWPRGALIGLATAIKLTPGLFIPYLWLTGRRRAAGVAVATFVAAEAVAHLVMPAASRDYWTRALFASDRLGSNAGTSNQSIRGMLLRLHADQHVTTAAWALLALLVLAVGARRALSAHRAGDEVAAVALVGLVSVAVSPVSWIHHIAWIALVVAVLADDFTDRRRVAAALAVAGLFCLRITWWGNVLAMHHGPLHPFRVLQDGFGLAVLALIFSLPWRERLDASSGVLTETDGERRARSLTTGRSGIGGAEGMTVQARLVQGIRSRRWGGARERGGQVR